MPELDIGQFVKVLCCFPGASAAEAKLTNAPSTTTEEKPALSKQECECAAAQTPSLKTTPTEEEDATDTVFAMSRMSSEETVSKAQFEELAAQIPSLQGNLRGSIRVEEDEDEDEVEEEESIAPEPAAQLELEEPQEPPTPRSRASSEAYEVPLTAGAAPGASAQDEQEYQRLQERVLHMRASTEAISVDPVDPQAEAMVKNASDPAGKGKGKGKKKHKKK